MSRTRIFGACGLALALIGALPALATNGYFLHGVTTANKAMGGAGIALPQDAMAGALDPATLTEFQSASSVSLAFFNPNREYRIVGSPSGFPQTLGLTPGNVHSQNNLFYMPSLAWSRRFDANALGVSLEAHGGMNTRYPAGTFYGGGTTGVDLEQMFLNLSYAREIAPGHSLGLSGIVAYQMFEARGLSSFAPMSSDPTNLSNRGHDSAHGFGLRAGYAGKLSGRLSVAASYSPKIHMSRFTHYAGLFADRGSFDVPSNWEAGLAYRVAAPVTVAFDVQQIRYSEVGSVGNPMLPALATAPLGSSGGAGFGWRDMTVYKLGLQWDASLAWAWRAGYSVGNQPIPDQEVLFNILAPGVIERHLTAGFAYRSPRLPGDLNLALTYALSHTVRGNNPLEVPGQQQVELKMNEWEVEIGWSRRF